jgi:hypothetical protein
VVDSTVAALTSIPKRMLVIGGGIIGLDGERIRHSATRSTWSKCSTV